MKVLHLLSSTGFHGAESVVYELVIALNKLGVSNHLGVFDNAGRGDRSILDRLAASLSGSTVIPSRWLIDPVACRQIARYVEKNGIDVVHSHKYKTTCHALLARRIHDFPLVATFHNWITDSKRLRFYAAIDKRLARYCSAAVGVSQAVVDELQRFVPAGRVAYITNGIDFERYSRLPDPVTVRKLLGLDDRPLIGFVGRLTALKGVSTLLRALALIPVQSRPTCLIVGEGEQRQSLEIEAVAMGVGECVRFLGARTDVADLYVIMQLLILPSYVEAFPMVVLEAMAAGVPVIASPIGDIPSVVNNGSTGWLVQPGNAVALAESICAALADPASLSQISAQARLTVLLQHSAATMASRYKTLYESIVPQFTH